MKFKKIVLALVCLSSPLYATPDRQLQQEIDRLQKQTQELQSQLKVLQKKMIAHKVQRPSEKNNPAVKKQPSGSEFTKHEEHKKYKKEKMVKYHSSPISIHTPEEHPESIGFYPTALVADDRVITYVAGTPVVTSPYLGARPAFDGSDYIVNISSINRDIRLMQQRRRLYDAYKTIGYPIPDRPILAISGKTEPIGIINKGYMGDANTNLDLGSSELDVAAALNENVEAYIAISYDRTPPEVGPRVDNSSFDLNLGFVNIGNLDKTPFYFTAGQLYAPFGRYSSAMVSAPVTMNLARTKTRPFILGYKSQSNSGPFAATYIYRSDTNLGKSGVGGANMGYTFISNNISGEFGGSYISSLDDASGMQNTAANPGAFGGFGSLFHGTESVRKTQAIDFYGNIGYEHFNFAVEWVGVTQAFRVQDLSMNGRGAKPQGLQTEIGMTFNVFNKPSSVGAGYQWTKDSLALNLPQQRIIAVFNTSIWKDTVESIEYRHDIDYGINQFANGSAPAGTINTNTLGTGHSADTVSAQIGVYF